MVKFSKWLENKLIESVKNIVLTPKEVDMVNWAIDAMEDGQEDLFEPGVTLPQVVGNSLIMSADEEVTDDLLYRLETQIPDIYRGIPTKLPNNVSQSHKEMAKQARDKLSTARSLAKKIRENLTESMLEGFHDLPAPKYHVGDQVRTLVGEGIITRIGGGGKTDHFGISAPKTYLVKLDANAKYGWGGKEIEFDVADIDLP